MSVENPIGDQSPKISPESNQIILPRLNRLVIATGILFTLSFISAACSEEQRDLGSNNVPFVNVELTDSNGDGILSIQDARLQKGIEWPPGLDMNGDFALNERDLEMANDRVGTSPVNEKFDINMDGVITCDDVRFIYDNVGENVANEDDPNMRLDELWIPRTLDQVGENIVSPDDVTSGSNNEDCEF